MKEKILVYDTSFGYGKYFEKEFNPKYEVETSTDKLIFKKKELFNFDTIIFIANESEDVNLFSQIYNNNKGIKLFLGITQGKLIKEFQEKKDIHYIDLEFNKKDIIKFIKQKLKLQLA